MPPHIPDASELPTPQLVRQMRARGRSYALIAELYGAKVEDIYFLAHSDDPPVVNDSPDVIDLAEVRYAASTG